MVLGSIGVLVVDDFDPWHAFVSTTLAKEPGLQIVGNASDGLKGVQEAERLQPDVIVLDIGLPSLNGIEAALKIRQVCPRSKILFLTENTSPDIAEEALSTGAAGYVTKSDAGRELLPAIRAIRQGKRFISTKVRSHFLAAMK